MNMRLSEKDEENFIAICGGQSEGVKAMRITMPTQGITDPDYPYVKSCDTDGAGMMARARARVKAQQERDQFNKRLGRGK